MVKSTCCLVGLKRMCFIIVVKTDSSTHREAIYVCIVF